MRLSKKRCCFRLVSVIACLSFTFSSLPACQAKAQESPRFCLVLDPFTHCVEKVQLKDIFSVMDLHFLASESSLAFSCLLYTSYPTTSPSSFFTSYTSVPTSSGPFPEISKRGALSIPLSQAAASMTASGSTSGFPFSSFTIFPSSSY